MQRKIIDTEWTYDRVINLKGEEMELNEKKGNRKLDTLHSWLKMTNTNLDYLLIKPVSELSEEERSARKLFIFYKDDVLLAKDHNMELESLSSAKPFLVGGATLESLIGRTPDTYEYVREHKLPFDNIFLDFPEPHKVHVPFGREELNLSGLWLRYLEKEKALGEEKRGSYHVELFLTNNSGKLDKYITINFGGKLNGLYDGIILPLNNALQRPGEGAMFTLNAQDRKVKFVINSDPLPSGRINLETNSLLPIEQKTEKPLSDVPYIGLLEEIPYLCTNLINYINAHNVTIVKKEREVIELQRDERNKKKKTSSRRPFYLITIQDKVYEEPDDPRETGLWTLQERIFVRGHDRRYRDDNGNIKMTSWVSPCIKGPPNAPFREQRYQILYDKLRRENEMMAKYGVTPYSSDLVMPNSQKSK